MRLQEEKEDRERKIEIPVHRKETEKMKDRDSLFTASLFPDESMKLPGRASISPERERERERDRQTDRERIFSRLDCSQM